MPGMPSGYKKQIRRPRNDRRGASRLVFRARFVFCGNAAALESPSRIGARKARGRRGVVRLARVGCGSGGAVARGDGAADLARQKRALRQKGGLAGIFGAFLLCVPPRAGASKRQLASRTWVRGSSSRRPGVECFTLSGVWSAAKTNLFRERVRVGAAN